MRLSDIMSVEVKTIAQDATVVEARTLMNSAGVRHLIVLDRGAVVGVLSDRDLGGRVSASRGDYENLPVSEVMSPHVVSLPPDATIRQAANRLRGHGIGCLAIMDDGDLLGIVTTSDLLELIGRGVQRPIEGSVKWTMGGRGHRGARPQDRHARHS
jgi:CBS domain-containing protein